MVEGTAGRMSVVSMINDRTSVIMLVLPRRSTGNFLLFNDQCKSGICDNGTCRYPTESCEDD